MYLGLNRAEFQHERNIFCQCGSSLEVRPDLAGSDAKVHQLVTSELPGQQGCSQLWGWCAVGCGNELHAWLQSQGIVDTLALVLTHALLAAPSVAPCMQSSITCSNLASPACFSMSFNSVTEMSELVRPVLVANAVLACCLHAVLHTTISPTRDC